MHVTYDRRRGHLSSDSGHSGTAGNHSNRRDCYIRLHDDSEIGVTHVSVAAAEIDVSCMPVSYTLCVITLGMSTWNKSKHS